MPVLLPALGLLSLSTFLSSRSRNPLKWHIAAPLLLGISVIAWALYYQSAEGTLRFWGDVATRTSGESPSALEPLKLLGFIEPVMLYTGLLPLLPLPLAIYRILRSAPRGLDPPALVSALRLIRLWLPAPQP